MVAEWANGYKVHPAVIDILIMLKVYSYLDNQAYGSKREFYYGLPVPEPQVSVVLLTVSPCARGTV